MGSLVVLSLFGYDIVAFEVTVLLINWIVLIASGVLLGVIFKRAMTVTGEVNSERARHPLKEEANPRVRTL